MLKNLHIAGALVLGMTSAAQAEEHLVVLTGFAYFPGVIYAHPGDTVRFINESGQEQTVVGKDADWVIGPLGDNEEASIKINAGMELLFFAAHDDDDDFGTYEQAPVRAEITFENPPLNG